MAREERRAQGCDIGFRSGPGSVRANRLRRHFHAMTASSSPGQKHSIFEPPGARESNAGDEFHVLWAMSRLLRVLDPSSGLSSVLMESLSPLDEVSKYPDMLLAADMTEYFGGDSFDTAESVVVSQLKYSQRHPNKEWTAARLSASNSRGRPGIVERLADIFKIHLEEHGRDATLKKLRLRVVSNQPASPDLIAALRKAQAVLDGKPRQVLFKTLTARLNKREEADLRRMLNASKLSQRSFSDLIRLLAIDDLGAGSRALQERQIVAALGQHVLSDVNNSMNGLYRRVQREALPEGAGSPGLTKADLLAELGATSYDLFPLPSRYSDPEEPIATDDVRVMARRIVAGEKHLVAHGAAGVGKTTTLGLLESNLPTGSTVIRYDCFGAGEYLSPAEPRHAVGPALLQIINMLAVATGTPLLVGGGEPYKLWQQYQRTLGSASSMLLGDSARLVIAIDAADNAAIAGRKQSAQTFLSGLWELPLPERVHLVMTTRSHRAATIGAPDSTPTVQLAGFDEASSGLHLRRFFKATQDECAAFHAGSNGNPRTQFYVLDQSRVGAPTTVAEVVDASELTPEAIFSDLVNASTAEASSPEDAHRHLADLICLTRPVTINSFANAIGESVEVAERFCDGMIPGLLLEGEAVAFRDEDFETYVRSRLTANDELESHRRLADRLMAERTTDEFAATTCAEHLFLAGEHSALVELAVSEPQPAAIGDPVARAQAYFRRIELAMKVGQHASDQATMVKLTLLAATAAAASNALTSVVRERPDLAMEYSDPVSVERILNAESAGPWNGVRHMRLAGMYGRAGELDLAGEQLELTRAWLRRRHQLPDNELRGWDFEAEDFAASLRAVHAIDGPAAVVEVLSHWRPLEFVLEVGEALVRSLAIDRSLDLSADILDHDLPAWVQGRLLAVASRHGVEVHPEVVAAVASEVLAALPSPERLSDRWAVDFGELVAKCTRDAELIRNWFAEFSPAVPEHGPHKFEGLGEWLPLARRAATLAAIDGNELQNDSLIPDSWTQEANEDGHAGGRRAEDVKRLAGALNHEAPILLLRAQVLTGVSDVADITPGISEGASAIPSSRFGWEYGTHPPARWLVPAAEACLACLGDASELIDMLGSAARTAEGGSPRELTMRLAQSVILDNRYRDQALRWLDEVVSTAATSSEPPRDRAERLLAVSAILHPHDVNGALSSFHAAIDAADGLDDEGAGILNVHAGLARRCTFLPEPDRAALTGRLSAAIEQYQPFVSEDGFLPWPRTLAAATALHPPSGIALMSRWDLQGHIQMRPLVASVVRSCVESEFLTPAEGVSLLFLAGPEDFSFSTATDLLAEAFDANPRPEGTSRARLRRLVDQVVVLLTRDVPPSNRRAEAVHLHQWADDRNLRSSAIADLGEMATFVQTLPDPPFSNPSYRRESESRKPEGSPIGPSTASMSISALPAALDQLVADFPREGQVEAFLNGIAEGLAPAQRRPFLDVLAELPSGHRLWSWNGDILIRCVGAWCTRWKTREEIREWARDRFPNVVGERFSDLIRFGREDDKALVSLEQSGLVEDPASLIIAAAGPLVSSLSARQLFAVASSLGRCLDDEACADALDWALARGEDGATPSCTVIGEPAQTVASLLWALFGHPERALRWSAAHTSRALLADQPDVLAALVDRARSRDAGSHIPDDVDFLWMSALQWTMLVIARLAAEHPTELASHVSWIIEVADDESFPHVSIRELARRSALTLHRAKAVELKPGVAEHLEFVNQPVLTRVEPHQHGASNRFDDRPGARFRFDSMDTIPYWYEPLGKLFGLSAQDVANKAERWIVDEFGFDTETVNKKGAILRDRYEWEQLMNDHGAQPAIEDLRTYLEYHAMLLVAGELLDARTPVVRSPWDSNDDRWARWIAEHLDVDPTRWVADRRDMAPLRPWAYNVLPSRQHWRDRSDADFDAELGLDDGHIVIDSTVEVSCHDRYSTSWVASALVSPKSAQALLRALQTAKDPSDFRLPEEQDGAWPDDSEIDEAGFRLTGWVLDQQVGEFGLEKHDGLRRVDGRTILPGTTFRAHVDAHLSADGNHLIGPDGPVASMSFWSDDGPRRFRRDPESERSSGWRTTVDIETLLDYLDATKMDLMFEVRIQRQFIRDDMTDDEEGDRYERGESRIYLLRADGRLETVAGRRQVGRPHRASPRA